ncbi:hypothetical protein FRC12_023496, partial [Ceratobasidium sp. 428]
MAEPSSNQLTEDFRAWAAKNQVFIHPSLEFVPSSSGHNICSNSGIPPDTKVLSCPFDVAITAPQSRAAIESLFQDKAVNIPAIIEGWNERQLVCVYIALHFIWTKAKGRHQPYLNMLPPPSKLLTPLYFNQDELGMLEGSNLHPATLRRLQEWQTEWKQCSEALRLVDVELAPLFT